MVNKRLFRHPLRRNRKTRLERIIRETECLAAAWAVSRKVGRAGGSPPTGTPTGTYTINVSGSAQGAMQTMRGQCSNCWTPLTCSPAG